MKLTLLVILEFAAIVYIGFLLVQQQQEKARIIGHVVAHNQTVQEGVAMLKPLHESLPIIARGLDDDGHTMEALIKNPPVRIHPQVMQLMQDSGKHLNATIHRNANLVREYNDMLARTMQQMDESSTNKKASGGSNGK